MNRRILFIDTYARFWHFETLQVEHLQKDPREDYFALSGEPLCQYLLRRNANALIIARGPMPYLSGNKASIGYISPLTGVPHYSFVGGRASAQLLYLGLDAICFITKSPYRKGLEREYVVVKGRVPDLTVTFKSSEKLPRGQRSAYYRLLESELAGNELAGSIFTIGEGAELKYKNANLAVDIIFHAGRGGAGYVFQRYTNALVLHGELLDQANFFQDETSIFACNPNLAIASILDKYCARLRKKTGGTITKLYTTGANSKGKNTLPALNARQLGYSLADIGGPKVLKATREGQTGCHWCRIDCRHWHRIPVNYTLSGYDIFLDDFEPTYAVFAMLGLTPAQDTFQAKLDLIADVDKRIILPIEQMGCDVIDIGVALAALFEGVEKGIIPKNDVPDFIVQTKSLPNLESVVQAVEMLRAGDATRYPALKAVGDGPQALVERYPPMQDFVFTGGKKTLGNAGHCNELWTFLMPFGRFFGHYVGQYYKIDGELPAPDSDDESYRNCFEKVVNRLLAREFFWLLCNALSQCAFTFVIFSQDGKGERLSDDNLLIRILRNYGIQTTRADLEWFGQAFWAQSIDLKCHYGWQPPSASDIPFRVYEGLSLSLNYTPEELRKLMDMLIDEWKKQAGNVMSRFGYKVTW